MSSNQNNLDRRVPARTDASGQASLCFTQDRRLAGIVGLFTALLAGLCTVIPDAWAGVPPPPPGCPAQAQVITNDTPVLIPTGPAVVSSTITVTGAAPFLWDVDLETFITHTFAADLDITLTSPAGTIVTLTTDNGGGSDNVFNGTLWDDDANPGGQVPYTSNDGLVTDATYTNLVVKSPLVPEEALGAFIGEDPNGTWTLTISDDLAGDGGNLASWTLHLSALPFAPTFVSADFPSADIPKAIPTGPAVISSTKTVVGAGSVLCGLNLTTNITHTFANDLDITLASPAGTIVTLTTDNGSGNDNVFNGTLWSDHADPDGQVPYSSNDGLATDSAYVNLVVETPLVPEEAMGAFIGEDPNGMWTLTISDDLAGDGGNLVNWTLHVTTCSLPDDDGDGVANDCDNCPIVANPAQVDTDSDGLGDACDLCPDDPLKIAPGLCGCNAADTDTDGDAVADCLDGCPNDPLKVVPGLCGCDLSDTLDSDGDVIPDCIDNCPDVANTLQTDSDGDGVGDACEPPPAGLPGCGGCGAGGPMILPLTAMGLIVIRLTTGRRTRR